MLWRFYKVVTLSSLSRKLERVGVPCTRVQIHRNILKHDYQNNQIYINIFGQAIFRNDYREHIAIATEDRRVVITDGKETRA